MPNQSKKPGRRAARRVLSFGQFALLVAIIGATAYGLYRDSHQAIIGLIAWALIFWIVFMTLRGLVMWASTKYKFARQVPAMLIDNLPSYTIFVPLYKEGRVLPELVESIGRLQYPKEKLQVLLLLETEDDNTWGVVNNMILPSYFEAVKVREGGPKSKPNALNFGLAMATGTLCVIYDAEDKPDSDQLLKAVAAFRSAKPNVACFQARLAFHNQTSNWVSRFYWAEYVIHFEWTLAGLAKLGLIPPLGGTSNHFLTDLLREVAIDSRYLPFNEEDGYVGGWDPYNMTEDAELAVAFSLHGYVIDMLNSTTWEEAPTKLFGEGKADTQRRRWLKGYAQTGLMYTRRPVRTIRQLGLRRWLCFNLIMLGTPLSLMLNPIFWGATVVYFVTRTTVIEQLFPLPLFYLGLMLMVVGNLGLFYLMMGACLKREGYSTVKYMLLVPVWWMFTSWSAWAMLFELMVRPHHWHKTEHGHDLNKEELYTSENTYESVGELTAVGSSNDPSG